MTLGLKFFNEIDDIPAEVFLAWWMPMVDARLSSYLGMGLGDVNVILDVHQKHKARFPPMPAPELWKPENPHRSQLIYRFAVATCELPTVEAPAGIEDGEDSIYVDLNYVDRLALELGVSREAMLAPVAAHELSHLMRGHHTDPSPHRRFLQEGDAQRDANAILRTFEPAASSVSESSFAGALGPFVDEAIRAQQELAVEQPDAYRNFPHKHVALRPMTTTEVLVDALTLARVQTEAMSNGCPILDLPEGIPQNGTPLWIGGAARLMADGIPDAEVRVVSISETSYRVRFDSVDAVKHQKTKEPSNDVE